MRLTEDPWNITETSYPIEYDAVFMLRLNIFIVVIIISLGFLFGLFGATFGL